MSVTVQPAPGMSAWRALVIGLVALLAIGIGATAGTVLLTTRASAGAGPGAGYVPADAPMYVELRVRPSDDQDAALREILGRFPAIEGIDLDRPLHDQWVEKIDEMLDGQTDVDLRWSDDVAPWFDGSLAFAVTELDADALTSPSMGPEDISMLAVAGVTDAAAARDSLDRLLDAARDTGAEIVETEHRGVTIFTADADEGAFAVVDDALLLAPTAGGIRSALDRAADGSSTLAEAADVDELVRRLPSDWLAFGTYDLGELMAASFEASAEASGVPADAFGALFENQSLRGAFAVSASGARIAADVVAAAPTGPLAVENEDRGLAAEVPADALYYAEGGSIGPALAAMIEAMKEAATADPSAAEELATIEAALGAELEELVSWIDDGALVAGWDGSEPYLGMVLVPNDVDAAERRLDQLAGFARLAALDAGSGISVEEREVAGASVTTIRWETDLGQSDPFMPVPSGVAIEFTVTDDRAVIGLGERFVGRVLELESGDALAAVDRYADAVAELGGPSNAGVAWVDLDGVRDAFEATLLPLAGVMDASDGYADDVLPWLEPLDRLVTVTRIDGDLVVQRGALLFD